MKPEARSEYSYGGLGEATHISTRTATAGNATLADRWHYQLEKSLAQADRGRWIPWPVPTCLIVGESP